MNNVISIPINVNTDLLEREIEATAKKTVIDSITKKVEGSIGRKDYYNKWRLNDDIQKAVTDAVVAEILDKRADEIEAVVCIALAKRVRGDKGSWEKIVKAAMQETREGEE